MASDGKFLAMFLMIWTLSLIDNYDADAAVDARPIMRRSTTEMYLCGNPAKCQCITDYGWLDCTNHQLSQLPRFRMMDQIGVRRIFLNHNEFHQIPVFNKRWWKSLETVYITDNPVCQPESPLTRNGIEIHVDVCQQVSTTKMTPHTKTEVGETTTNKSNDTMLPPWWVPPYDPFYIDDYDDDDGDDGGDDGDDGGDDGGDDDDHRRLTTQPFDDVYYGQFLPDAADYPVLGNDEIETLDNYAHAEKLPDKVTTTTTQKPHMIQINGATDYGYFSKSDERMYFLISICISTPIVMSAVILIIVAMCKKCNKCMKKWRNKNTNGMDNVAMENFLKELDHFSIDDEESDGPRPSTSTQKDFGDENIKKKKKTIPETEIDVNEPSRLRNGKERKGKGKGKGRDGRKEKESDSEEEVVYENIQTVVVDITQEPRARMRATSVEKDL